MRVICAVFNQHNYNTSIAAQDMSFLSEAGNTRDEFVPNTGASEKIMSLDIPLHSLANITKKAFDADYENSTGSYSGNPGWPLYIKFAAGDYANASSTISLAIQITYDVIFYDRNMLAQS